MKSNRSFGPKPIGVACGLWLSMVVGCHHEGSSSAKRIVKSTSDLQDGPLTQHDQDTSKSPAFFMHESATLPPCSDQNLHQLTYVSSKQGFYTCSDIGETPDWYEVRLELKKGDKGDKGDRGEKGDQGEKGDPGQAIVSVTDRKTLVSVSQIAATGSASQLTYLRGDGSWSELQQVVKPCPQDTASVNDKYCIDIEQKSGGTYQVDLNHMSEPSYFASVTCMEAGGRLCDYQEWMFACSKKDELGLLDMLASSGDASLTSAELIGNVFVAGSDGDSIQVATVGEGGRCSQIQKAVISTGHSVPPFRCCYDR